MFRLSFIPFVVVLAACGGGGSPTGATPSPSPMPAPTPTPVAVTVVRSAQIQGVSGHSAAGTAEIVVRGSKHTLELRPDFRIDSGRNDVYLTESPNRISASDLNLGDMKAVSGEQAYDLPHDGAGYRYVMLWCRPFQVPIGVGELRD